MSAPQGKSPWTSILESLHSSLIDELNARLPKITPTLGMPVRQSSYKNPPDSAADALCVETEANGHAGAVLLAFDSRFEKLLSSTVEELWSALTRRAGAEFGRRGIQPRFSAPVHLTAGMPPLKVPQNLLKAGRVVWVPFLLGDCVCFLGIAA